MVLLKVRNILSALFFLMGVLIPSFSQTGVVSYGEIQSMGMGGAYGQDYNAILVFNKNSSLFVTRKDSLEGGHLREQKDFANGDGKVLAVRTVVTNPAGFLYYNDLKNKILYSRDLGFRYVKDTTIDLHWQISDETKTVGDYTVQKAQTSFRGREYTAWFTTAIPLPYGPWKLSGLPGLILEAYDTNKEIYWYFKNIEYPSRKGYLLKKIREPQNGWITFEEYKRGLIKAFVSATRGGRMVAESIGASGGLTDTHIGRSYIEAFVIEEQ